MQRISIQNSVIIYYNNPAGYLSQGQAVVDPLFESEEMKIFLSGHEEIGEIKWIEGVFERLINGQKTADDGFTLLKNCRIWQLRPESDILMRFIGYEDFQKQFGPPGPKDYQVVYEGEVASNDLEAIYTQLNRNPPPGYGGHLLSMSDVVELYDESSSTFHYCDRFGFQEIDFEQPGQGQVIRPL